MWQVGVVDEDAPTWSGRRPDAFGLSDDERQRWLEELRAQLIEETGQPSGVVEQRMPGAQPVWAMWGTDPA